MTRRLARKLLFAVGVFAASIVLAALTAELALRAKRGLGFGEPTIYRQDAELGWSPIPDFRHDFRRVTRNGEAYVAHYETNRYGFRHWGDPGSGRPRILFVGDSYTQDANMSNDAAYYAQVARALPVEVFAIGGGGYGTLQEVLLLEKYWPVVEPTHVVIQFCDNDPANNDYETESLTIVRNQKNFRPYLVHGRVVFRSAPVYRFLFEHSLLFRNLDQRLQNLQHSRFGGYSRPDDEPRIRALDRSRIDVTREILQRARSIGGDTVRWYMFNCRSASGEWVELAREAGFEPIVGVAEAVEAAESRGAPVRTADGAHWNELAHEIGGKALAEYLGAALSSAERP